jgi:hypothetical protein
MPLQETPPEFKLSEVEQKAYELLAKKRERIDLDSFSDLYDRGQIEKDKEEVERLERIYETQNTPTDKELKKMAELFEVLFGRLVELEDWFGENVFVIETSKIDDYKSGVDMVAEFLSDGLSTQLGLAVDITFSSKMLVQKIAKIAEEIKMGKLPRIKYFVSGSGDRGEKNNIPRVILGTDRKTLSQLAELWLDLTFLQKRKATQNTPQITERIRAIRNELQNHPIQIELLAQIEEQLERFSKFALLNNRSEISSRYSGVLPIIRKIRKSKKDLEENPETKTREMKMYRDIETSLNIAMPSTISAD